jgi:hypothetical protein
MITRGAMAGNPLFGGRPKQMIRNKFQFTHNFGFANPKSMAKGAMGSTKQLQEALDKSEFIKNYSGYEIAEKSKIQKLDDLTMYRYKKIAKQNVVTSYKTAWYEYEPMITNPKYKDMRGPNGEKWVSDRRTYWKDSKGELKTQKDLFPEEIKTLEAVCEDASRTTQFDYSRFGKPTLMQNKTLAAPTRLMSWPMHYQNMVRWGARRLGSGATDQGLPLTATQRSYALQYVVLGGAILMAAGYSGKSFFTGAIPEGIGVVGEFSLATVEWIKASTSENDRRERKMKSAERTIRSSLKTIIPYKGAGDDTMNMLNGDLSYLFFYESQRKLYGPRKISGGPSKLGTGKVGGGKLGVGKKY